jgi:hypothetical protein
MMRVLLAILASVFVLAVARPAAAQPIVTDDPREYMETLRDAMGVSGMGPLRSLYQQLAGSAGINPQIEAALMVYERNMSSPRAAVARVTEDITLGDTLRTVYLYHYWGDNLWVHTRLDFVRISPTEWAVAYIGFGSEWHTIAQPMSPGFRPSPP